MNKISKINKKYIKIKPGNIEGADKFKTTKTYTYLDLFKYKSLRAMSIYLMLLSVGVHLLYYGI